MKKILILLTISSLLFTACKKDFLEINSNPNAAVQGNISVDLVTPMALNRAASYKAVNFGFLNAWMGYWARSGTFSANSSEESYIITVGFNEGGLWNTQYDIAYDFYYGEQDAKARGFKMYEGICKVMRAYLMQDIVDIYGNVPYSKAFNISGNILPAYDNGQDIYNGLLVELNDAIALIKASNPGTETKIAEKDIFYKGNKTNWIKFANTLKLRLLIHQSQIAGFNPSSRIAEIVSEGSGFIGSGQSAMNQPGYIAGTVGKLNPFWESYMFDAAGQVASTYWRANKFALDLMRNLADERHRRYFSPATATGTFKGVEHGLPPLTSNAAEQLSNMGLGMAGTSTASQFFFTSPESMFLQAEAVARGWLTPAQVGASSAQDAYNRAVTESFVFMGVPSAAATAATYLAQTSANIAWPVTTADQIKVILTQKYFALCGLNPLETWCDYRRTAATITIPLTSSPSRTSTVIPVRLLYPSNEYSTNVANVSAQGTINQFTSRIFWDQ
jgi:hypothetical protein